MWKNYFIGAVCLALDFTLFFIVICAYPFERGMFGNVIDGLIAWAWLLMAMAFMGVFNYGLICIIKNINEHHHILEEV